MSRHQAYRNYDYEKDMDEYDGEQPAEEGAEQLSAQDQASMSEGTASVQRALGLEVDKVTVAQIEEALWHYYYDVDKTVAYLIGKHIAPVPKLAKGKAKKDQEGKKQFLFFHYLYI